MSTTLGFKIKDCGYSYIVRNLSQREQKLLKTVFLEADEDLKGYLNTEDLKVAMVSLFGYKPSKSEANQILQHYGHTRDDEAIGLNLAEFTDAMTPKVINIDEDEEIRQTFMAFDSHCKGFVTGEDLKKVFAKIAPHMSSHCLEMIFRELDRDGDGRVSYKDFDFMMKFDCLT
ncbi:EF-hand calcium-binding domain-containing protein 11-like [Pomacea canaliculata]|uniref:EF-hand calcium-binding domain-containing protein 11-like n=1 Tax=Pomacea canaliculata TaxID=400727 RepID=UPI000D739196|nr:EF-hand calcium-binding domain-containing protein 11-like [Pomacea canaliculata]